MYCRLYSEVPFSEFSAPFEVHSDMFSFFSVRLRPYYSEIYSNQQSSGLSRLYRQVAPLADVSGWRRLLDQLYLSCGDWCHFEAICAVAHPTAGRFQRRLT